MTLVKTPLEQEQANAALLQNPDYEQEYWVRQARGALHRQVLAAEGKAVQVPRATTADNGRNGGQYVRWLPITHCGSVADDAVSGFCGPVHAELIHLDCGGA